jgi:RNA polymerase subunit RPABC4/transcription elongation factor Spt4
MAETDKTRTCPGCAEFIKAAAKICPHCQTRQGRFALWWQELSGLAVILALVGIWIGLIAWFAPEDSPAGRSFVGHQAELKVGKLTVENGRAAAELRVTGSVTNTSKHPWRVWEMEVQFRAADGQVIDVQQARFTESFVVQPFGEAAFSHSFRHLHPEALKSRIEGRVLNATDGNKPRDPD